MAAEGTGIGSIFLDLIVRDTTDKQIQKISENAQNTAQKAFSGVERATEKMVSNVTAQAGKVTDKVAHAAAETVTQSFNKAVALAEAKARQIGKKLESTTAKLWDTQQRDSTFKVYGYVSEGNKEYTRLLKEQEKLLEMLESAEERLAIEREAAAQKAVAAAEKATLKQEQAAQRAAEKQERAAQRLAAKAEAAAQRETAKREAAAQKAAAVEERAAQKAAAAEEKAASRRKAIHAAMWKNMLSKAAAGAKAIAGKLTGIGKGYDGAGKAGRRFSSRLREIASGALLFNGISAALRNVVNHFSKTIASTDQMQAALANLKGAAANAASPIIQVLTPALTALANAAATVFSYVARLLTMLTGKIATTASSASKSAGAAKKAMASLAGFDEIQRLDGKDEGSGGAETVTPNYDFEGKNPFLDEIMAAIEAGQWGRVGSLIALKLNDSLAKINWPSIRDKATTWTQNLVDTINGFIRDLNWGLVGSTIGNGLNTILTVVDTFFAGVDWKDLGRGIGAGLNGLFDSVDWVLLANTLSDRVKGVLDLLNGFLLEFDWQGLAQNIEVFLANVDWSGITRGLFTGIGAALGGFGALIWEIIREEWDSMINTWLENTEKCGGDIVAGLLVSIVQGLANIGKWIVDNIFTPFIEGFKEAFGIHSPSTVMEEQGGFIIAGLLGGITSAWEAVPKFFQKALADIHSKLTSAFTGMKNAVSDIWKNGIVPAIKGPINSIISAINGMISGIVSGLNSVIGALNGLSVKIPDWPVFGDMAGKSFGFNIGYVSAPQIPMLKDGGAITQPTLAMMGEYAGARNNPEIVAPQNIMRETVADVMQELVESNLLGFESVVAVLKDILETILGFEIDGRLLFDIVENQRRKRAVQRGGA